MKISKKMKGIVLSLCLVSFGLGFLVPTLLDRSASSEEERKFEKIYQILNQKWYFADDVKNLDQVLMEQAISGMTTLEQDKHTNYFDIKQAQAFAGELEGSTVGLGFSYYENDEGNLVLTKIYVGSAADEAGLKRGDEITAIDTQSAQSGIKKLVKYIQSKENQSVMVKFRRNGQDKMVKAKPSTFDSTVTYEVIDGYGWIGLESFSSQTGSDFNKALRRLSNQGIHRIVIDLRGNTGGYVSAAVEIASSLLPEGKVVFQEKDKDGKITQVKTDSSIQRIQTEQIAILQNGHTASASEVLIGALKEQMPKKVRTFGTTTYGKGTEQEQISFKDGTSMKYTIAKWLTPKGKSIDQKGFEPDVEVEAQAAEEVTYEKFGKKATIQPDSVTYNAKALQTYLQYLGYAVDRTDEYFSATSSEALKEFQSQEGLEANGICNRKTWNRLVKRVNNQLKEEAFTKDPQFLRAVEWLQS